MMPLIKCAYGPCSREVIIHLKADATDTEKWNAEKSPVYCSTLCVIKASGEAIKKPKEGDLNGSE